MPAWSRFIEKCLASIFGLGRLDLHFVIRLYTANEILSQLALLGAYSSALYCLRSFSMQASVLATDITAAVLERNH